MKNLGRNVLDILSKKMYTFESQKIWGLIFERGNEKPASNWKLKHVSLIASTCSHSPTIFLLWHCIIFSHLTLGIFLLFYPLIMRFSHRHTLEFQIILENTMYSLWARHPAPLLKSSLDSWTDHKLFMKIVEKYLNFGYLFRNK